VKKAITPAARKKPRSRGIDRDEEEKKKTHNRGGISRKSNKGRRRGVFFYFWDNRGAPQRRLIPQGEVEWGRRGIQEGPQEFAQASTKSTSRGGVKGGRWPLKEESASSVKPGFSFSKKPRHNMARGKDRRARVSSYSKKENASITKLK